MLSLAELTKQAFICVQQLHDDALTAGSLYLQDAAYHQKQIQENGKTYEVLKAHQETMDQAMYALEWSQLGCLGLTIFCSVIAALATGPLGVLTVMATIGGVSQAGLGGASGILQIESTKKQGELELLTNTRELNQTHIQQLLTDGNLNIQSCARTAELMRQVVDSQLLHLTEGNVYDR